MLPEKTKSILKIILAFAIILLIISAIIYNLPPIKDKREISKELDRTLKSLDINECEKEKYNSFNKIISHLDTTLACIIFIDCNLNLAKEKCSQTIYGAPSEIISKYQKTLIENGWKCFDENLDNYDSYISKYFNKEFSLAIDFHKGNNIEFTLIKKENEKTPIECHGATLEVEKKEPLIGKDGTIFHPSSSKFTINTK